MRTIAVLATTAALLAAGCGGDESGSPEGQGENSGAAAGTETPKATTDASGTVTITMKDVQFQPAETTVKAGQTVRWVNEDDVEHNVSATAGAKFSSELLPSGESYEHTTENAGTVTYLCTVHPGMSGTLYVTE